MITYQVQVVKVHILDVQIPEGVVENGAELAQEYACEHGKHIIADDDGEIITWYDVDSIKTNVYASAIRKG